MKNSVEVSVLIHVKRRSPKHYYYIAMVVHLKCDKVKGCEIVNDALDIVFEVSKVIRKLC